MGIGEEDSERSAARKDERENAEGKCQRGELRRERKERNRGTKEREREGNGGRADQ